MNRPALEALRGQVNAEMQEMRPRTGELERCDQMRSETLYWALRWHACWGARRILDALLAPDAAVEGPDTWRDLPEEHLTWHHDGATWITCSACGETLAPIAWPPHRARHLGEAVTHEATVYACIPPATTPATARWFCTRCSRAFEPGEIVTPDPHGGLRCYGDAACIPYETAQAAMWHRMALAQAVAGLANWSA